MKTAIRAFFSSLGVRPGMNLPAGRRSCRASRYSRPVCRRRSGDLTMFTGSCHCGAVHFRIEAPIVELTTCDCSLCVKRNAVMAKVPENALTVVAGEELLTLYQWNTHRAKHYFCSRCGIYVFHRKRAAPDISRATQSDCAAHRSVLAAPPKTRHPCLESRRSIHSQPIILAAARSVTRMDELQ